MTRDEMEELKGLAASMGLYDDKNPCKRAVILGKAIKALEQQTCEDAVSRNDALKYFEEYEDTDGIKVKYVKEHLMGLPSVNPQPYPDSISRSDMLDAIGHGTTYTSKDLQRIIKVLPSVNPQPKTGWIPVSERLPEDFGLYLITLENGDVCQCEFNPDFIDEEHENGAFTYYHQYFDSATMGMIDEEEEAVDAIAWMQFEPFEPQESEVEE